MVSKQARNLARFHLDLAHALYEARVKAGLSVEELAVRSGLAPERVEMIEEGDTTLVSEIALLYDALGIGRRRLFPYDDESESIKAVIIEAMSFQERAS